MTERVRVTTKGGLNLRDSPRDGVVLSVVPPNTELEVLGRETWLRVNFGNTTGFVLADYVEPEDSTAAATDPIVQIVDVTHVALKGSVLRADVSFSNKVMQLAAAAETLNFEFWVTSSLREPYTPVSNAVVNPAQFSNHHVGHAFDMNIRAAGRLYNSTDMAAGRLPPDIADFLTNELVHIGLKWGATFTTGKDFVHIDDRLNVDDPTTFQAKLAALWG